MQQGRDPETGADLRRGRRPAVVGAGGTGMINQHLALEGRRALLEFFTDKDGDDPAERWFEVEYTNVQADDAGKVFLHLFMSDGSLVRATWLPPVPPPPRPAPPSAAAAALQLAHLITN